MQVIFLTFLALRLLTFPLPDPVFRLCTLTKRELVTHDTQLLTFRLPEGTQFKTPIGHHVYLRAKINGKMFLLSQS